MPLGISLFGAAGAPAAQKENAKEMVREWQSKLRGEVRTIERSIRQIERDEDKIKKDIKKMAKEGSDPKNIATLAKSVVRSGKAKGRLYQARASMSAASSELQNVGATMRLADAMKQSTEVTRQINQLVNIPELQEAMSGMAKEMMRAGLIEEMIDEGLEGIDGPELEEEAAAEIDKVLDELAVDAAVRLAVTNPAEAEAQKVAVQPQPAVAATSGTGGYAAVAAT